MRKVASAAGVPPPTLPRLAKAMGFDKYDTLREIFQRELQTRSIEYSQQAGQLQQKGNNDVTSLAMSFKQANLNNIDALFDSINPDMLEKVTDLLVSARTVYVVGMQASFTLASYLHYVASMAFPNWTLLGARNGDIAEQLTGLSSEDVIIAISTPPSARESILVTRYAQKRNTPVIGITNSRTTTLAANSTYVLITSTISPQFFDSYVSTLALLETLIGIVVSKGGQKVILNIDNIEQCRRDLGEYWEEN